MEMDTLYCDVIVRRWEEFTGKKAKREKAKAGGMPKNTPAGTGVSVEAGKDDGVR